jgi:hypothetical protein
MDSSVSPTHGEQEMSVWNGHYACICYHPLFVFNRFGDLERSAASRQRSQRRRLGRCAQAHRRAPPGQDLANLFPGGRGLRNARSRRVPGGGADQIRDPVACQPSLAEQDALAYNLGNFLRTLATPELIRDGSLTSLKEKLIKIGGKVVSHGRYLAFQMAEVAVPRHMFQQILRLLRSGNIQSRLEKFGGD